ncbi:MAG: hypothetical protein CL607_08120 [Anaerolineaceae bacterium]|nr:hypothetical protein [Anaerolineaceae bacterium]
MSTALVLAGHGSHILPETAGVIWRYVDRLRAIGVADEITAGFWKEQPEFSQVLKTVGADTVVIVPLFTASGYYVNKVIPAAMGPDGTITRRDGRTIYLTKTLGEHPSITDIVQTRVTDAIKNANLTYSETAVAIIGHGTARSNTTQLTTQAQVQAIRERTTVAEVVDAYLDDEPRIPSIYSRTSAPNLVVVPFFLAQGSHVARDVPAALGIPYGTYPARVNGRNVYYTDPIGTEDAVIELIQQLMAETGIPQKQGTSTAWAHFPQVGVNGLIEAINKQKPFTFGELDITAADIAPVGSTRELVLGNPAEIRAHVRENPFRPLASATDLPRDWVAPIENISQAAAVIETVYPGAIADWASQPTIEPIEAVIKRHPGMFETLNGLDDAKLAHFVSGVCGRCIKFPTWHQPEIATGAIPCSTPCNKLLSNLKENTQ